jgi:hypothetical protein
MGTGTMNTLRRILHGERGDLDDLPGWTILAVTALMLIGVIVYIGRGANAANTVQAASYAAARDASLSRDAESAVVHGKDAADAALSGNVNCENLDVTISGNGLHTGLGETGIVTATVSCKINTSDVFPLIPGSITISKTSHSPVDPYRQR